MIKASLEDYRLYLVTDPSLNRGYSVLEQVQLALEGGIKIIQIREKDTTTLNFLNLAREALELTRKYRAFLLINDRVDVAMATGADGVHLGLEDMPLEDARSLLGPDRMIGISVKTADEARSAENGGADYIAANGVFLTGTKKELVDELGLEGIKILRRASSIPLIGIGGIKVDNCGDIIRAGADGVAVVTGITMAKDIPAACSEYLLEISKALSSIDHEKD